MGAQVAKHNAKIIKSTFEKNSAPKPPKCNCLPSNVQDCPLPGACKQEGVVYQASVKNNKGKTETYIALASKFKSRYYRHKNSMEIQTP